MWTMNGNIVERKDFKQFSFSNTLHMDVVMQCPVWNILRAVSLGRVKTPFLQNKTNG